mmetsp:Transcript_107765/g.240524  ORF Transcript_107765/g.240524 Transcript_107765/m.240524 type:complete len:226 (-) Transcript_107765:496-1173(-)
MILPLSSLVVSTSPPILLSIQALRGTSSGNNAVLHPAISSSFMISDKGAEPRLVCKCAMIAVRKDASSSVWLSCGKAARNSSGVTGRLDPGPKATFAFAFALLGAATSSPASSGSCSGAARSRKRISPALSWTDSISPPIRLSSHAATSTRDGKNAVWHWRTTGSFKASAMVRRVPAGMPISFRRLGHSLMISSIAILKLDSASVSSSCGKVARKASVVWAEETS